MGDERAEATKRYAVACAHCAVKIFSTHGLYKAHIVERFKINHISARCIKCFTIYGKWCARAHLQMYPIRKIYKRNSWWSLSLDQISPQWTKPFLRQERKRDRREGTCRCAPPMTSAKRLYNGSLTILNFSAIGPAKACSSSVQRNSEACSSDRAPASPVSPRRTTGNDDVDSLWAQGAMSHSDSISADGDAVLRRHFALDRCR